MRKKKLLLVSEEPAALRSCSELLGAAGYEVATAASVGEAAGMIDGYVPDLILLEGVEPAGAFPGIPVVLIADLAGPAGDGPPPGVRRVIYRPCRPKTLIEGVESALRMAGVGS